MIHVINDFNGISAAMNSYQTAIARSLGMMLTPPAAGAASFGGNGNGQFDVAGATEVYNSVPAAAPTAARPK